MHELSIATSIFESLQRELARREGARPVSVSIRVGELAGVDADSLSFGWQCLVKGTPFEKCELKIESLPWLQKCRACAHEFRVLDYQTACPNCAHSVTELVSGHQLEIVSIEITEPEPAGSPS